MVFAWATALAQGPTWTANKIEKYNDYDYELWGEAPQGSNDIGTVSMTLTGDNGTVAGAKGGTFTATWSRTINILFRSGRKFGVNPSNPTGKSAAEHGNITIDFDATWSSGDNVKMLGVYGWAFFKNESRPTKDENGTNRQYSNQIEYYIIQDRGSYNAASSGTNAKKYGEATIDGIVYEFWVCDRIEKWALTGNGDVNFKQYFSVPKSTSSHRTKGIITVSKHFEEWEKLGMKMDGPLYEVALKVESYTGTGRNSNGSATINKNILTIVSIPTGNYTLTTAASPASGGTVTKLPNNTSYTPGTKVTLTATPAAGYQFTSWTGDDTGNAETLSVTMDKNKTVTANFTPISTGDENLVKNGTFVGTTNWTIQNDATRATVTATGGTATINITAVGSNPWEPQLVQAPIPLYLGTKYILSFEASASAARTIDVMLQMSSGQYTTYFSQSVNLTTTMTKFEYEFEMTFASDETAQLAFNVGQSTQNVQLKNVQLRTPTEPKKGDYAEGNRLIINGQPVFISGMNLAWVSFGTDVGDKVLDVVAFEAHVKSIRDAGGNAMRWWLHTDVQNCPKLNADGSFNRLGTQTIPNIQKALDIAEKHGVVLSLCLFSFDMMQTETWKANNTDYNIDRNYKFLTVPANLDSYIEKGLKPILAAVGSHPAIMCWEVFNEPEGMTSDKGGWSSQKITFDNVLRFTAKIAAEVHRSTTKMASTGIHEFGKIKNYSDAILKNAAGGDPLAYLDFYMAHYYPEYAGTSQSPFHNTAASWKADRPILIGEFPAQSWGPGTNHTNVQAGTAMTIVNAYNYAYNNGYCGLMSWSLTEGDKAKFGSLATTKPALEDLYSKHKADIEIKAVVSCTHIFNEWEETTAPTCEAAGVNTEKCSLCGAIGTKTAPVEKLGHNYPAGWTVRTEAKCGTKGLEFKLCIRENCGHEITQDIPALTHDMPETWTTETAATCETAAVESKTCQREGCEHTIYNETPAPKTGHSEPTGVWTSGNAATCTTASTQIETCTRVGCNHVIATDDEDALGHDYEYVSDENATCEKDGTETGTCSRCLETDIRTEEGSKLPHNFVWKIDPTNPNQEIHVCKDCNEPSGAEPKPITCEHDFEWKVTTAATCEKAGEKTEICSKCPITRDVEPIAKLEEHAYGDWSDWKTVESATCTTNGSQERTRSCTLNTAVIDTESEEIPATGHSYTSAVTAPTCEEEGYTTYTCVRGDHTYFADTIAELGHKFENYTSDENATCEEDGTETGTCSRCPKTDTQPEIGSQLEHIFVWTETTAPTCAAAGEETEICSLCEAIRDKKPIAKLVEGCECFHEFSDWIVETAATCSAEGKETRTCWLCGKIESQPIAQLEHEFTDWEITQAATCGAAGSQTEKCSICGALGEETQVIPATGNHIFIWKIDPTNPNQEIEVCADCGALSGAEPRQITCEHAFDLWKVTTPATCAAAGVETAQCSKCQVLGTATRSIAQLTHIFGNWSVKTAATCTKEGEETRTCTLCGEVESKSVAKAAHTFTDWQITKEATCGEAGSQTEKCSVCGELGTTTAVIPATGEHTFIWKIDPTNPSQEIHVCKDCNEPSGEEPKLIECEHTFEWKVTTAATCEKAGESTEICSKCQKPRATEPIAKLTEHAYGDWSNWEIVTAAKCEEKGSEKRTRTCILNAAIIDTETRDIQAIGHSTPTGAWTSGNAATCTTASTRVEMCAHEGCNHSIAIENKPALGHDFKNYTSDGNATCEKDGTETGTCSLCGEKDTRTKTGSQLAHTFGSWSVSKPATCTEFGEETRTCSICGKVESRGTAKTAHHYEWKIDPNNPNQEIYACVDCGTDLGITRPIICEHNFVWTVTFAPTCKTSGWEQQICSKCNTKGAMRPIELDCKTYKVTVINGTSNKTEYAAGEEVRIIANVEGKGNMFKQWSSLHVTFADAYEATTTFIMPAQDVTVTAVFETVGIDASTSSATEAIKIYPNPVKDILIINNEQLIINKIEIVDFAGRTVETWRAASLQQINVSNLSQGVYIIKMYTNDSMIVRRFVKE